MVVLRSNYWVVCELSSYSMAAHAYCLGIWYCHRMSLPHQLWWWASHKSFESRANVFLPLRHRSIMVSEVITRLLHFDNESRAVVALPPRHLESRAVVFLPSRHRSLLVWRLFTSFLPFHNNESRAVVALRLCAAFCEWATYSMAAIENCEGIWRRRRMSLAQKFVTTQLFPTPPSPRM